MSIETIEFRHLIANHTEYSQMLKYGKGKINIRFDDGDLLISKRWAYLNLFFWRIWLYMEPPYLMLPIHKEYHMDAALLTTKLPFAKIITPLVKWITLNGGTNNDVERLQQLALEASHLFVLAFTTIEHATGFDNGDIVSLRDDVTMGLLKNRTSENIKKIITHWKSKHPKNPVVMALNAGIVREIGVIQSFISLGNVANGTQVFPKPVIPSYWEGINYHPYAKDEQEEAEYTIKALITQAPLPMTAWGAKSALQDTEQFRRKVYGIQQGARFIEGSDCGVTWGFPHTIQALPRYEGLHYKLNNAEPVWRVVQSTDRHLIGTPIYLRTAMTCQNHNKQSTCKACFGPVHTQYSKHQSPCFTALSAHTHDASQNSLSKKHQTTASVDDIPVWDAEFNSLLINKNDNVYIKACDGLMLASMLGSFRSMDRFIHVTPQTYKDIPPSTFGSTDILYLRINDDIITINLDSRLSFTPEYIKYIGMHPEVRRLHEGNYHHDWSNLPETIPVFKINRKAQEGVNTLQALEELYNGHPDETKTNRHAPYVLFQRFMDITETFQHHAGVVACLMPTLMATEENRREVACGNPQAISITMSELCDQAGLVFSALYLKYAHSLSTASPFIPSRDHPYDDLIGTSAVID